MAGEIRRGRWEGLSGKSRRGAEGDHLAHSGLGSLLSSQVSYPPPKPPPGHVGPRGIGGRPGDLEWQAGGAIQEERERRGGCLPHPLEPRKPAGLLGEVP